MDPIKNSFRFFRNTDCQYFPCHAQADPQRFNCLFCYCPLYLLGRECGGNFRYVGENASVKDCGQCILPHNPEYYEVILQRLGSAQGSLSDENPPENEKAE